MPRSLRYRHLVSTNAKVDSEIEVPGDLARLHLPEGLERRLQALLDKQDGGTALSADEQTEAKGLVDLADLLTLLRLRSSNATQHRDEQRAHPGLIATPGAAPGGLTATGTRYTLDRRD